MKGGHAEYQGNEVIDLLFDGEEFIEFRSERIPSKQTHGSGCTFASAVTAGLAKGYSIEEAVQEAKRFISIAIEEPLNIGFSPSSAGLKFTLASGSSTPLPSFSSLTSQGRLSGYRSI